MSHYNIKAKHVDSPEIKKDAFGSIVSRDVRHLLIVIVDWSVFSLNKQYVRINYNLYNPLLTNKGNKRP